MAVVSVERAEAGMVLKGAVTDRRGRLLIPAGLELSDKHVKALRMWGIESVEVDAVDQPDMTLGAVDAEYLSRAREILEPRFRHCDLEHPVMAHLLQHCVERLGRELQRDEGDGVDVS